MHIRRVVSFPLHAQTQQGFIDERNLLDIPRIGGPSRTLDDDQDDEMSESTEMTSARNSKRVTGITAHNHCEMRVRYDLMMKHMDSSHVRRVFEETFLKAYLLEKNIPQNSLEIREIWHHHHPRTGNDRTGKVVQYAQKLQIFVSRCNGSKKSKQQSQLTIL